MLLHLLHGDDLRPALVLDAAGGRIDRSRLAARTQHWAEVIGCHQGVAQCDIYTLSANRGHGVGRIPEQ